jgi:hypothetical protein
LSSSGTAGLLLVLLLLLLLLLLLQLMMRMLLLLPPRPAAAGRIAVFCDCVRAREGGCANRVSADAVPPARSARARVGPRTRETGAPQD